MKKRVRIDRRTNSTVNLGTMWVGRKAGVWPATPADWRVHSTYTSYPAPVPTQFSRVCYDELHSGPPYLEGGPLDIYRMENNHATVQSFNTYVSKLYGYYYKWVGGSVFGGSFTNYFPPVNTSTHVNDWGNCRIIPSVWNTDGEDISYGWGDVSSYGATAWNRFKPGRSSADLGVFLGEFREVPRMLKGTAARFYDLFRMRFGKRPRGKLKKFAEDWLNVQFGWKPFLKDLVAFYETTTKLDKIVRFIRNNQGKAIKRTGIVKAENVDEVLADYQLNYNIPAQRSSGEIVFGGFQPVYIFCDSATNMGSVRTVRLTETKVWFEGQFKFWTRDLPESGVDLKLLSKIFGLKLDPILVWNLIPWSWLVDWYSNVGDVISNLCSPGYADNLVATYAYLMGSKESRVRRYITYTSSPALKIERDVVISRKTRRKASPFGFSLDSESFSARQWSILAALGITKW